MKFNDLQKEIKGLASAIRMAISTGEVGNNVIDLREMTKKCKELLELVSFDMIATSNEDFYGNFLVLLRKKFNYNLNTAISHQVICNEAIIHINPLLIANYSLSQIEELLKKEVYHIVLQHASRSEKYVGVVPGSIIALAADLVVNEALNTNRATAYTYNYLKGKGIQLNRENTMEDNIEALVALSDCNLCEVNYSASKDEDNSSIKVNNEIDMEYVKDFFDKYSIPVQEDDEEDEEENEEQHFCLKDFLTDFSYNNSAEEDMDTLSDFVRTVIVEASQNSRGYLPSGIKAALDELIAPPKISWKKVLVDRLGSLPVPYKKSIVRNNRRLPDRLELKGRISDRKSKLFVGIDTSASVSDEEIMYVLNEIKNIARNYKTETTVIECDSDVQRVYDLNSANQVKRDVEGRGGTAFTPVIDYVKENAKRDHVVLIYFTDGEGESYIPETGSNIRIIWVLTRGTKENLSVQDRNDTVLLLEDDTKFAGLFR